MKPNFSVKEIYDEEMYQQDLSITRLYPFDAAGNIILFSGNFGFCNGMRAKQMVEHDGTYQTITSTRGGKILDHMNFYVRHNPSNDPNFKGLVWGSGSAEFAKSISGDVITRVCGSKPQSIFRSVELLHLLHNKSVKTINAAPREVFHDFLYSKYDSLLESGINSATSLTIATTAVFRKIAIAELRQSLQEARTEKNDGLYADALCRLDELKWQHKMDMCDTYNTSFMEGP